MDDIKIKPPKYIVYHGNLYELKETNVIPVIDYDEAIKILNEEKNK